MTTVRTRPRAAPEGMARPEAGVQPGRDPIVAVWASSHRVLKGRAQAPRGFKAEPILQPPVLYFPLAVLGQGELQEQPGRDCSRPWHPLQRFPELCSGAETQRGMARAAGGAEPGPAAPGQAGEISQPAPIGPWIFPGPGLGQRLCPKVVFLSHKFISVFEPLCLVRNN